MGELQAAGQDVVVNVDPADAVRGGGAAGVAGGGEVGQVGLEEGEAGSGAFAVTSPPEEPDEEVRRRLQERLLDPSRHWNLHYRSFEMVDQLGEGGFGTVFRVKHRPTGAQMALKVVLLDTAWDTSKFSEARSEFLRLKQLQAEDGHPNIVLGIGCTYARIPGYVRSALAECG